MKDDTSTPTPDGDLAPNDFERDKAGTAARDDAEAAIEKVRQSGGVFVDAVRATRMPMALTDPNLPGNPIVFANAAFLKLSGYSMADVLGQQPHFMNGPATDPKDAARFTEALRADQDDLIETVQYRKNGSTFIATVLVSAFKDEQGRTLNHFMSWLDVTRRVDAEAEVADLKAAQAALRESEARLAAAFESVPAGLAVLDLSGRAVIANAEFRRFLPTGVVPSRDPLHGNRWQGWSDDGQLLDPHDWPSARALRGESVIPGQEMLFTNDEGRKIWTNVATAPILDDAGEVTGIVSVISNIDKRKRAEEALQRSERHAQLLVGELQHRVRNMLAVIRSIALRTSETTTTSEDMLAHFQGRLDAFSRVQSALTRSADATVDLALLIEDELIAYAAREGAQLEITGPEIALSAKTAERLSLAIHELATNAAKHGALTNRTGRITINWTRNGDQLDLSWIESGVQIDPAGPGREGFGMDLLRRSLPYDLGGETEVELTETGLRFTLRMSLRNGSSDVSDERTP